MSNSKIDNVKKQAVNLAIEHKKVEPNIKAIYWIPNEEEVRLIELEVDIPKCLSGVVEPFYFAPSPTDKLEFPSGIALILPEEFKSLKMPKNWGNWDDAEKLEIEL